MTPNDAYAKLVKDGTIYKPSKDAIFELVDAILKRNVNLAFDLLEQCYEVGEATMVMLSVMFSNTKQVLQVQACDNKDITTTTGLTAWQVKQAKERCGYYSIGELVYMLKLIHRIEKGIKTGRIEEDNAMQYILVNVL